MTKVELVPLSPEADPIHMSSRALSLIMLCLATYGITNEEPDTLITGGEVPQVCEALAEICPRMIDAGLRDIALEAAFFLSVLPNSGGIRTMKRDS